MKQPLLIFLVSTLFISACASSVTNAPVIVTQNTTATPPPTPNTTQTFIPSSTPTASIAPLPTISAFTPTFDVSTIVTVTPAPKAECLKENLSVKLNLQFPKGFNDLQQSDDERMNIIHNYLNAGGSMSLILDKLSDTSIPPYQYLIRM